MSTPFSSRMVLPVLAAVTLAGAGGAIDSSAGTPAYRVSPHAISAGGNTLHNSCYRLSGTLAQVAPGYSSGDVYTLDAGYWTFPPATNSNEIFYAGFEEC